AERSRTEKSIMAATDVTVGVIGLGSMGLGVARTLCRAGFETWGFDVRDAAVLAFEEAGGHAASSPAALGREVDVAIVLVATADQVRTVLFGEAGAAAAMHEGSVVIASATVPASVAVETGFLLS